MLPSASYCGVGSAGVVRGRANDRSLGAATNVLGVAPSGTRDVLGDNLSGFRGAADRRDGLLADAGAVRSFTIASLFSDVPFTETAGTVAVCPEYGLTGACLTSEASSH